MEARVEEPEVYCELEGTSFPVAEFGSDESGSRIHVKDADGALKADHGHP